MGASVARGIKASTAKLTALEAADLLNEAPNLSERERKALLRRIRALIKAASR